MTECRLQRDLDDLIVKINCADKDQRYVYHHRLENILLRMRVEKLEIPPTIRRLKDDLQLEVVEAQFDNMPV